MSEDRFYMRHRWPAGPWDKEPDRLEWRYAGLPCLIVRGSMGALCGYVAVSEGHPWHSKNSDDIDASVHGGITYTSPCDVGGGLASIEISPTCGAKWRI